jgi:TonB family protein
MGGIVPRRRIERRLAVLVLGALSGITVLLPLPGRAQQDELPRKVKTRVSPAYPDLARRMSISGVVKVQVVVAPNGVVKSAKIVGGHPLLVNAAVDAVKKWKFETAAEETTGIVEFKFDPSAANP